MNLKFKDKEIFDLINEERKRQNNGIELIASENFTSESVLEALGSILVNKYSEGQVGKRYYGGNQVIDKIEQLCKDRALKAFGLNENDWDVNVQTYSGSIANMAVYNGLLNVHDRIMGLDLPSGGHLSHGYYTSKFKISATSKFFESLPYSVNKNGFIDYDELEKMVKIYKPKLLIVGASAYPRDYDYKRFREIADINKSYLMCDMAHYSGLVVTKECNNPFEYCDVVTTTTHKTLRGPRGAMIFYKEELKQKIDMSVFPGLQGGPHNNKIASIAVQMKECMKDDFKEYIKQVKRNAKYLAKYLMEHDIKIMTNGTDNHLLLISLKNKGLSGSKVEKVCELVDISLNKNTIVGDKSAFSPSGIRIGTPAMTTRGCKEKHMEIIGDFLIEVIELCQKIQKECKTKLLREFNTVIHNKYMKKINEIKNKVNNFSNELKRI